jgi:uncharacterized SAM-binding protein YcdF (DUF218 family)
MFFVLSKTLHYLTIPLVIIVGLLVWSTFIKNEKLKKSFFRVGLMLLLFFSNEFIANEVMRAWEVAPTHYNKINKHYKIGIILSGFTKYRKEYSDRVFMGLDRVTHAVQLYKAGRIDTLLISGGHGDQGYNSEPSEAEQVAKILLIMGVDESDIILEPVSRNTHESSLAVAKLLLSTIKPEECLLITSGNHMRRSRACFIKAGFAAQTFSTDLLSHETEYTFEKIIIPSANALWHWQIISKEIVGCIMYKVMGYI